MRNSINILRQQASFLGLKCQQYILTKKAEKLCISFFHDLASKIHLCSVFCKDENSSRSLVNSFKDSSLPTTYDCIRTSTDFIRNIERKSGPYSLFKQNNIRSCQDDLDEQEGVTFHKDLRLELLCFIPDNCSDYFSSNLYFKSQFKGLLMETLELSDLMKCLQSI